MDPVDGRIQIGVGEDDIRALAAQLERQPLQRVGGRLMMVADLGRAGEGDFVHVRMLDQGGAGGLGRSRGRC